MGSHTEIWELVFPSRMSLACTGPEFPPYTALGWLRDSPVCGVEEVRVNLLVEDLLSNGILILPQHVPPLFFWCSQLPYFLWLLLHLNEGLKDYTYNTWFHDLRIWEDAESKVYAARGSMITTNSKCPQLRSPSYLACCVTLCNSLAISEPRFLSVMG